MNLRTTFFCTVVFVCCFASLATPAMAGPENLVVLTPAQRTNGRIETMTLDPATAPTSSGLTVTGRVEPGAGGRTAISAPASGRIVDVAAYPGSMVRRGAPILTLAGPEIAGLQRALREAQANETVARQRLKRDRAMLHEGVIAASRLEQTEALYLAAAAQMRQASAVLPAKGGVVRDGELPIRAPVDGVLSGAHLAVGERVEAGDMLGTIGAPRRLRVALAASAEVARAVRAGDAVTLRSRSCEERAVLESVGTGIDSNQTVPLNARISGDSGCLLPGETVTASIAPRTAAQGAWALPPRAFVRRGADSFVFVERAGRFEAVPVDPVAAKAGFAKSAVLRKGDRVAISGTSLLKGAWIGIAEDE